MDNSVLTSYARLRLLVGYLGEKAQANWWSTSFFEKVSRTFLEPVFPRTYQLSQYNGVRQAASLLHDEFIGVGSAFHLFRLPEENEQDLQQIVLAASDIWFQVLSNQETAMNALSEIAGEQIEVTEGPKLFGMLTDIYQHDSIQGLAQHYLGAFKQEVRCLPYFTKLS